MAYRKRYRLFLGKKSSITAFGLRGMARGMYSGGYTYWVYGIKGIIGLHILEGYGDFYTTDFK